MTQHNWLLFNSQLPASPSSPRVMVWRRMKAAGAVGLQNGVWVLPHAPERADMLQELLTYVEEQGGSGQLFVGQSLTEAVEAQIHEQFESERNEEYGEFLTHCQEFLDELERETREEKFTYGELEESEANYDRLEKWLQKIQGRDFFESALGQTAVTQLTACQQALQQFTESVYNQDIVDEE